MMEMNFLKRINLYIGAARIVHKESGISPQYSITGEDTKHFNKKKRDIKHPDISIENKFVQHGMVSSGHLH
jgi:hypothetical protein